MAVYVDPLFGTARTRRWPFCWACHLFADDVAELHTMAQAIGLKRSWFQPHPRFPHYDLTESKRAEAILAGAVEARLPVKAV